MKTLEVIHLRMVGDDLAKLTEVVQGTVADTADAPDVRVYRHPRVEGDLLIHLHWDGNDHNDEPSALGLSLASLLRIYGMAEHSVWVRSGKQNTASEGAGSKGI